MRLGVSWPGPHRRRYWISMGPGGWLLLGLPLALFYTIVLVVVLTVWLLTGIAVGVRWLAWRSWHA